MVKVKKAPGESKHKLLSVKILFPPVHVDHLTISLAL